MDKWLKTSLLAAVPLAGAAAAFYHFHFAPAQTESLRVAAARNGEYEHCRRQAEVVHDVHWAAACMVNAREAPAGDDHPECMLPDAKAALLYAALDEAEARCRAEAGKP